MANPDGSPRIRRTAEVLIVSSVMFTFISYWRTAAVVLCDLSSTAYYIGAIVESSIGKAAPWFILAVMLFSYAMRSVYIESCSLFVRGGVYRVVKEAMGGFLAKLSVSALLFDYVLTGPISSVSAGQYIIGLVLDLMGLEMDKATKGWWAVFIACGITLYFFRQNLIGIPESSDKALKIMIVTTVMLVIMLVWSGITLVAHRGEKREDGSDRINALPPLTPDLSKKYQINKDGTAKIDERGEKIPLINELTGEQEDPLGFLPRLFPSFAEHLRDPNNWWTWLGLIGLVIAFGHSVLAMSGEETLAQVYREVESPKLPNFKKAAFVVFVYSLVMTVAISFLAVLLIPEADRLDETKFKDNLISGLVKNLAGPSFAKELLNAFVVVVGFLILSGGVNTSIIGSNGVLNRVAEDGVLPDWFLKPHHRYGTTNRILYLITGMQLVTIIASQGDVILLGEAYAFGVVWSFVFKALAMVVLRFKDRSAREFKVPLNIRVGNVEVPIGLCLIFLVVLLAALGNLVTKEVATYSGVAFTLAFLIVFVVTEKVYESRKRASHAGGASEHLEQFNMKVSQEVTSESLGLTKQYRRVVAIRSPHNLFMLEKTLSETDPQTTDVVVMTAKSMPLGGEYAGIDLDTYDQHLMTAVVERAEKAGKQVKPLIVPTNNPLHAVLKTAKDIQAQEIVLGASNKFTAEEQLDQIAFYWISLHEGHPLLPLTVRILNKDRDVYFDLEGGNRIPKIGERQARSVSELRASGVGVDRVVMIHDGTPAGSDLFSWVLTMLDPEVVLDMIAVTSTDLQRTGPGEHGPAATALGHDREQAERLGRKLTILVPHGDIGLEVVRLAREGHYDLIIAGLPEGRTLAAALPPWMDQVMRNAHCPVFLAAAPLIPKEVEK
jgi:amino acid transporter/nucleotide-binding universal stress UspA family protein